MHEGKKAMNDLSPKATTTRELLSYPWGDDTAFAQQLQADHTQAGSAVLWDRDAGGNLRRPEPPLSKFRTEPSLQPHFLGRPDLLRKIKETVLVDLQKPVIVSGTARVSLQGIGGIGNSVLATMRANRWSDS